MYRWILITAFLGAILAFAPAAAISQPPPPPVPPGGFAPGIAVYRVYYYHTLRPRKVFLYGTYTDYNAAAAAANYWNSRPRFKAYIG